MKKISLYILIILAAINILLPFNIVLNGENNEFLKKNIIKAADDCTIVSAKWNPSGEQSDDFYKKDTTNADIVVKTKNCVGQTGVKFSIIESDGYTAITDDYWNDSGLYERSIFVPTDNFTIRVRLGEEDCEGVMGFSSDCDLYFEIGKDNNMYSSYNKTDGDLWYDCVGNCKDDGKFLQIIPQGTDDQPIVITPDTTPTINSDVYTLLAPIGKFKVAPENIGDYFNTIFNIAIGFCGVLAVIMIVIGGVQYMGDESVFGKTDAKDRIKNAILGLLIALGSFALLNTINPDLLGGKGVGIKQLTVEIVDLPDAGDGSIDPGFASKDWKYSTDASVSPGVTGAVSKLKDGWEISSFRVYPNERMGIILKKGAVYDNTNVIDVRSGINGFSEVGQGVSKDKKTPKGNWKILNIKTTGGGKPVYNKEGSNMGASFWLLSPTTNGERGIGMHGNKNGTLSRTYGCVRLKNSDILALLPYVKTGTPVIINN